MCPNFFNNICSEIIKKCHTNTTQHHCIIVQSKNLKNTFINGKLSYGINSNRSFYNISSTHSEMEAIYNLKNKQKLPKSIDILVIKLDRFGNLGESKPCYYCLQYMNYFQKTSKIIIKNIYYSTKNKGIIKVKFHELLNSDNQHISYGMKKKLGLLK
jgi:cytidine deaminase